MHFWRCTKISASRNALINCLLQVLKIPRGGVHAEDAVAAQDFFQFILCALIVQSFLQLSGGEHSRAEHARRVFPQPSMMSGLALMAFSRHHTHEGHQKNTQRPHLYSTRTLLSKKMRAARGGLEHHRTPLLFFFFFFRRLLFRRRRKVREKKYGRKKYRGQPPPPPCLGFVFQFFFFLCLLLKQKERKERKIMRN